MRLQIIYLVLSALVYFLSGLTRKYTRKQRLLFALGMYVALYTVVAVLVLITGDQPF